MESTCKRKEGVGKSSAQVAALFALRRRTKLGRHSIYASEITGWWQVPRILVLDAIRGLGMAYGSLVEPEHMVPSTPLCAHTSLAPSLHL